ncbi:hypothetical protein ABT354_06535 [Streptomyces sp. NPDC000594]|uniref:hypothetical protein n=1 Tax=Streptomyces sp. NPDC000594 TaxID=3154261 RepID=UPI0033204C43
MSRNWVTALVVVALAVPMVYFATPSVAFLLSYGCGDREDDLGKVLAAEKVLESVPPGATRPNSFRECDDDDLVVGAGTEYRYDGKVADALAHFRKAAPDLGWKRAGGESCYTKQLDGTTAYLDVYRLDKGRVTASIAASHEFPDESWC